MTFRSRFSGFGHDKSQAIIPYLQSAARPTLFFFGDGVSGESILQIVILDNRIRSAFLRPLGIARAQIYRPLSTPICSLSRRKRMARTTCRCTANARALSTTSSRHLERLYPSCRTSSREEKRFRMFCRRFACRLSTPWTYGYLDVLTLGKS